MEEETNKKNINQTLLLELHYPNCVSCIVEVGVV